MKIKQELKSILNPETVTIHELKKYFLLSHKKAVMIDCNIKKLIAKDDSKDKIESYVKNELKDKKSKKRVSLQTAYSSISDKYIMNNEKWMDQENLFCFFALIVSTCSMISSLISKITSNKFWESDFLQLILYGGSFIVFLFMEHNEWLYVNKKFGKFLNMLNRNAPLLIMLSTFLFYFISVFPVQSIIKYCCMGLCALFPLCAILKTIKQLKK